jgi:hypothetical protein
MFPFSRTLSAGTHQITVSDSNILCDTSSGVVNLILPSISDILNFISIQGYSIGSIGIFSLNVTDISNNASVNNINILLASGNYFSNNLSSVSIDSNNGNLSLKPISETLWSVFNSSNPLVLTTIGTSGASTLNGNVLNIPIYTPSLNYGLFAQTANSPIITATTTESTLIDGGVGTLSVPPNGFQIGDSFQAVMGGIMSAQNNNTITIRVKSGSVVLADSGALTMPQITNQVWNLTISFTIRNIGNAGVASITTIGEFLVLKLASGNQEGFGFTTINNTTFNTTIANTLNITAQWSSNNINNSIYSNTFILNKIY